MKSAKADTLNFNVKSIYLVRVLAGIKDIPNNKDGTLTIYADKDTSVTRGDNLDILIAHKTPALVVVKSLRVAIEVINHYVNLINSILKDKGLDPSCHRVTRYQVYQSFKLKNKFIRDFKLHPNESFFRIEVETIKYITHYTAPKT